MPFGDDDESQVREDPGRVAACKQERERFGCRDGCARKSAALSGAKRGGRVAGSGLERPRNLEILVWLTERFLGVGRECAQWSDPEDTKRWRPVASRFLRLRRGPAHPLQQRTTPRGER